MPGDGYLGPGTGPLAVSPPPMAPVPPRSHARSRRRPRQPRNQHQPRGQHQPQDPRPPGRAAPAGRTWWILPYCAGLVAVLLMTGAVIGVQHATGSARTGAQFPARPTRSGPPMPSELFPNTLFATLTKDIQTGNENGFLSTAAASARPAMQTWWENLRAIGFTTGAVIPTASQDEVRVDQQGNGSTVVLAGTHNSLDPVDSKGKPYVALERYRIGLHFATPRSAGQITSWQSLSSAPWDSGAKLYVRKDANVVVAGLPADSALVDETLPIAQAAAAYDIGLVNQANFRDLNSQQGFVVFVAPNPADENRWLATGPQEAGWPPQFFSARTFVLPGPGISPVDATSAGAVSDGTVGGARIVVGPYTQDGNGGTPHSQEVTLVRDFMLAILASHDEALANGFKQPTTPTWSVEGLAVAVQELFEEDINPAPASYDFSQLTADLATFPASPYRTGQVPTGKQLFSASLDSTENWNEVAASVYAYIEQKYGINQMLASAMLLWTRYSTPFGNVLASSTKSTYSFYTATTVETGWRQWLASL